MKIINWTSFFAAFFLCLASCISQKEFDQSINRIGASERQIATINQQIATITGSISELETVDVQLKEYIDDLKESAAELQNAIDANAQEIASVEEELKNEINAAKLEQLEALKALEEDLNAKLKAINQSIADLQAKDAELEAQIASLKKYVDKGLGDIKDWVSATFATIEQYNSTVTQIAGIVADIDAINQAMTALEASMTEKIDAVSETLTNSVATLEEKLGKASVEIYAAISKTEESIKTWVNTQLTEYYTIAQIDAKLAVIEAAIGDGDAALLEEIKALKTALSNQKDEITEAYKKAISEAITNNNGVIDDKIQCAVSEINGRITEEISSLNQKITDINNRLNGIEESLAEILGMIQSIVVVPSFSDGSVALGEDETSFYFEILPLDAAKKLESVALSAISLKAVSTIQTKADVEYKTLPVNAIKYEEDLVKITTSGKDISQDFFNGVLAFNARLSISDGLNSLSSAFFGLKPSGNVDITSLRIAEYKSKILNRIIVGADNNLILSFVDGSSIYLTQNSVAPRLYLDYDGYWSVSYNNGETSSRLMNSNAEFINAGNLNADSITSVRFVENENGYYSYQTFQSIAPQTILDELETPVSVDHANTVHSIVEDNVNHAVTITINGGADFYFQKSTCRANRNQCPDQQDPVG